MTKTPKLPMRPEDLPQQRLHLVSDLPPRPESFKALMAGAEGTPEKLLQVKSPRTAEHLATVEWSWSPVHSRIDAYFLSSHYGYWLLWNRYFNDWEAEWRWEWSQYAYAPKKKVSARVASIYLLMDAWTEDKEHEYLDPYHFISETEALSVSDLEAIVREVWPEHDA